MDDLTAALTEIEQLHERWVEALNGPKGAVLDAHSHDPVAGCEPHGGQPVPSCGNCFLSDWALIRVDKSVEAMRGQGVTMRTLKAKASHYRFVVLELARREQERKARTKTKDWKIVGFDPFDMGWYPIKGTYATEEKAEKAAQKRLKPVRAGHDDIQDRMFLEGPDGEVRRVFPRRKGGKNAKQA